MHDILLTGLVSTVTVGLVVLIYVAILSTMRGPLS
jgi:hypothetical protein